MRKINFFFVLVSLVLFILGIIIGSGFKKNDNSFKINRSLKNRLTNPLLDCEIYESNQNTKVNQIKKEVMGLIDSNYDSIKEISVYFRDLNNGPSFGINENNKFAPASLLKVPLMIAYLKQSETDSELLNKKIEYKGVHNLSENLPEADNLKPGESYDVNDLIYRMIAYSDNLSFELLLNNINQDSIKKVHQDLDLIYPDSNTPEDYISVKSYAGLFRVLYNSTYLNRETSEKALNYLTKSDFHLGIEAGVPKNTVVALKFGVRDIQADVMQMHDCGIVYDLKKPYLLCIMTKGSDQNKLIQIIKDVSELVYKLNINTE